MPVDLTETAATVAETTAGDRPATLLGTAGADPTVTDRAVNTDRFFRVDHLQQNLKKASVRGGTLTMAGQGARSVLRLVSTVVLARLLTPNDFGVVAMVTAVTAFIGTFKDLGLSLATVQRSEINHAQVSALFWVNVVSGITLTLITAALSPLLAWFYGEPRLLGITLALSVSFVFAGLTVQHQALLRRQMKYGSLVVANLASVVGGVVVAVIIAVLGGGYWSLVAMTLATTLVNAAAVWWLSGWRPSWYSRTSGVRSMLGFGGNIVVGNFCTYIRQNFDNVLIGWCWGASSLGIYTRAYQLFLTPTMQLIPPISPVAVSTLSRLQDDPERFRRFYVKAVRLLGYGTMPPSLLLLMFRHEVVRILLGPQWTAVGDILGVLALVALFQPVFSTIGWPLVALNQTGRLARWSLFVAACQCVGFMLGVTYGPMGMASALAITFYLLCWPHVAYCLKGTPIRPRDLAAGIARPLGLAVCTAMAVSPFAVSGKWEYRPGNLTLGLAAAVVVALVLILSRRGFCEDIREAVALLKTFRQQRSVV